MPASISQQEAQAGACLPLARHVLTEVSGLCSGRLPKQNSPSLLPNSYTKPCPLSSFRLLHPSRDRKQYSSFTNPSQQAVSKGRLLPERAEWCRCHVSTRQRPRLPPFQKTTRPFWRSTESPKGISPGSGELSSLSLTGPLTANWATLKPTLNLTYVSC